MSFSLKVPWIEIATVVIIAAGVVYLVTHAFNRPDPFVKDKAVSVRLDSAHVQRHDSSARVDSTIKKIEHTKNQTLHVADSIQAVADTIGQSATSVRDSLEMWKTRDSLHVAEVDSLRAVRRSDELQILLITKDRDDWKLHSDSLVTAMDVLRGDLTKAQADECHVLPFVPCLSRKESLVVGLVAGALIASHPTESLNVAKKIVTLGRK